MQVYVLTCLYYDGSDQNYYAIIEGVYDTLEKAKEAMQVEYENKVQDYNEDYEYDWELDLDNETAEIIDYEEDYRWFWEITCKEIK